jgi:cyclic pyranopterin phosphate synthase
MPGLNTLRLSITDRCNLRCVYCLGPESVPWLPPAEILSFEELRRVARVAVELGARKIRITGGEPLVRKGIEELVRLLAPLSGLEDLALTTNGVLLAEKAAGLKAAGLARVTVSLDTLRPDRFRQITGRDGLERVIAGLEAAAAAGLGPIKINVVLLRDRNQDEVLDFVRLAAERRIEVRFIERMPFPFQAAAHEGCSPLLTQDEVKQIIEREFGPLEPLGPEHPWSGPARVFAVAGLGARVGFISPITQPFCSSCGRMRLTPEGRLRPCLAADTELDLKGPLRAGASDRELRELFLRALQSKPVQPAARFECAERPMSRIGG